MTAKAVRRRRTEQITGRSKFGKILPASGIGMGLLTGLLFLAAAICLRQNASGWLLPLCAYLCCAVSAFSAGCIAAKRVGKSGLLCGLLASLPLCLLLLILCLALYGAVGPGFFIGSALILFFGALGGIAALNLRRKKRYR